MGPHDGSSMRDIVMSLFLSLVFLSLLINGTGMAHAAQELPAKRPAGPSQHSDLSQSIEKTLRAEEENVRRLKDQLNQAFVEFRMPYAPGIFHTEGAAPFFRDPFHVFLKIIPGS